MLQKYAHVDCELLHNCSRTCLKKSVRNARGPRPSFLSRPDSDSKANPTERSPGVFYRHGGHTMQSTGAISIIWVSPGKVQMSKD